MTQRKDITSRSQAPAVLSLLLRLQVFWRPPSPQSKSTQLGHQSQASICEPSSILRGNEPDQTNPAKMHGRGGWRSAPLPITRSNMSPTALQIAARICTHTKPVLFAKVKVGSPHNIPQPTRVTASRTTQPPPSNNHSVATPPPSPLLPPFAFSVTCAKSLGRSCGSKNSRSSSWLHLRLGTYVFVIDV